MSAPPFNFSKDDLETVVTSLPTRVDPGRLRLLGPLLRDWARNELPSYLELRSRSASRTERVELQAVSKRARLLREAIRRADHFWIVRSLIEVKDGRVPRDLLDRLDREYVDLIRFLEAIEKLPDKLWPRRRGRARNVSAYLIISDIAAIFEWLTRTKASRAVNWDTGKSAGPFYRFAAAIWTAIFKSEAGLSAAMKNWAEERKKYRNISAALANIHLRHPTWGIFEK